MPRLAPTILVLLLPACAHRADDPAPVEAPQAVAPQAVAPPQADAGPTPIDAIALPPANYQIRTTNECPGKPAHVNSITVEGNQLYADVGASGCTEPEIWACWNGRLMTSRPPQLAIEIHQSDTGDCEQLIRSSQRFDLGPLVGETTYDTITIRVGAHADRWNR